MKKNYIRYGILFFKLSSVGILQAQTSGASGAATALQDQGKQSPSVGQNMQAIDEADPSLDYLYPQKVPRQVQIQEGDAQFSERLPRHDPRLSEGDNENSRNIIPDPPLEPVDPVAIQQDSKVSRPGNTRKPDGVQAAKSRKPDTQVVTDRYEKAKPAEEQSMAPQSPPEPYHQEPAVAFSFTQPEPPYHDPEKDSYEDRITDQIAVLAREIRRLKASIIEAQGRKEPLVMESLRTVAGNRTVAKIKLRQLSKAGPDKWKDLKPGVETAMQDLEDSVNRTREYLSLSAS